MSKSEVQGMNEVRLCHAEACRLLTKAMNEDRMRAGLVRVTDFRTEVVDHCKVLILDYGAATDES